MNQEESEHNEVDGMKKGVGYTYGYTAIKNPLPDWVKLSFVIFDIWAL